MTTSAWGVGLATVAADGTVLDTRFRALGFGDAIPSDAPRSSIAAAAPGDPERGVAFQPVELLIDTTTAPTSASDVYLRLHLLSHRMALPRTLNLDGAFGLLANVAWTSRGPVALDQLESITWNFAQRGDYLVVNRFIFSPADSEWERRWLPVRPVRRGDIIVFKYRLMIMKNGFWVKDKKVLIRHCYISFKIATVA